MRQAALGGSSAGKAILKFLFTNEELHDKICTVAYLKFV